MTPLTLISFQRLSECTSWNRRHSATQCDPATVVSSDHMTDVTWRMLHDGCHMAGASSIGIVLWPLSGFLIYRGWRNIRMASSRPRRTHRPFMALELLFGMVYCGGGGSCGSGNGARRGEWGGREGGGGVTKSGRCAQLPIATRASFSHCTSKLTGKPLPSRWQSDRTVFLCLVCIGASAACCLYGEGVRLVRFTVSVYGCALALHVAQSSLKTKGLHSSVARFTVFLVIQRGEGASH